MARESVCGDAVSGDVLDLTSLVGGGQFVAARASPADDDTNLRVTI